MTATRVVKQQIYTAVGSINHQIDILNQIGLRINTLAKTITATLNLLPDESAQLPIELAEVPSEIDISVETIERYILKALPGWQAARQNEQEEYCAPINASDIAEGHGNKSEWRRVKFLMNNGAFSRITFYEVVSEDHPRGRRWVRINKKES